VDDKPGAAERIMPRQTKMPISKWRNQLLDFRAIDPDGRIRE
jgi:hypothetical protein